MILEPTTEEHAMLERIAKRIGERVRGAGAEPIIGGSFAKNTWLSGSRDLDIFARFEATSESELTERAAALFEAFPEAETVRGSREYLRLNTEGVTVELIPIRPLGEHPNTMDRSPDHITYVNEHLARPNDVRILKTVLRARGIYGAESYVRGFSGYVCELLIIAYGSLDALALEASHWERGARVRFNDANKPFDDVLIVEDPTDSERNAAAAVDERSFDSFTTLMRRLRDGEPIEKLVEPHPLEPPYALVRMQAAHEKRDVGFAKLRALHDRLERELRPFGVRASHWSTEEDRWESRFVIEHEELEPMTTRKGPPTRFTKAAESFREHHPDAYEEDGILTATVRREETLWTQVVERVLTHHDIATFETEVVR